jgi:hypothetical protein
VGGGGGRNAPTTKLDALTRNFYKTTKKDMAYQPAEKKCDSLPHPRVAFVEWPFWEKKTHFQKCVYMQAVCAVLQSALCNETTGFVVVINALVHT